MTLELKFTTSLHWDQYSVSFPEPLRGRQEKLVLHPMQMYTPTDDDSEFFKIVLLAVWGLLFNYRSTMTVGEGSHFVQFSVPEEERGALSNFRTAAYWAIVQALHAHGYEPHCTSTDVATMVASSWSDECPLP